MALEFEGSPAADTLSGTAGEDIIRGLAGDDSLNGLGSNDTLDGGDGSDTLAGDAGNDVLLGGAGNDLLGGGEGSDLLDGGAGNDTLLGNGVDAVLGGPGDDLLSGNGGTLDGGDGNDTLSGQGTLGGGAGDDILRPSVGSGLVNGGLGFDTIETTDLRNYRLLDVEQLSFAPGAVLYLDNVQLAIVNTFRNTAAGNGRATVNGSLNLSSTTLIGFSGVTSSGATSFIGTSGSDSLGGGVGGFLVGGAGDDFINASALNTGGGYYYSPPTAGLASVFGGDGNDIITLNAVWAQPHGSGGIDSSFAAALIDGGAGEDRLVVATNGKGADLSASAIGNIEVLRPVLSVVLTAAQLAGFREIDLTPFDGSLLTPASLFSPFPSPVVPIGTVASFQGVGTGSYDFASKAYTHLNTINFRGGAGGETVYAPGNADSLSGGAGDDRLFGGWGNDTLAGGEGNDLLAGGAGQNGVSGSFGFDTLYLDGGRRAATISRSTEFTTVDANGRAPSFAGTATTAVEATSFTGIERFAFVDGQLLFDTGSTAFSLARMYLSAFGRAPDGLGLTYHAGLVDRGSPLSSLAETFSQSTEFQNRFAGLNDRDFVTSMYQNTLGRAPDADGLAFWSRFLDDGVGSRGSVLLGFSQCAEFVERAQTLLPDGVWLANPTALSVARLYQTTLGRKPDEAGLGTFASVLDQGVPLRDVVPTFLGSAEFSNAYGAPNDAQFVTILYHNALGRAPDAAGYQYWVGNLAAGQARADVAAIFSESQEAATLATPWTADGIVFA